MIKLTTKSATQWNAGTKATDLIRRKHYSANNFSKKSCLINGDKTNPYNYITIVHCYYFNNTLR